MSQAILLSAKNLTYSIPYGKTILEDISFEIRAGELVGVLGANGSGKTTLVDIIMGAREITSGSIEVMGEEPNSNHRLHAQYVSYISHDIAIKRDITIDQFVKFHSMFYQNYDLEVERETLDFLELNRDAKVGSLSTGQQKKLQVVTCLSCKPKLLVIDEITAVLDPKSREKFYTLIMKHQRDFLMGILLATNIVEDLKNKASRVLFIQNKKLIEKDPRCIDELFELGNAS